jgi:hypothetical protein
LLKAFLVRPQIRQFVGPGRREARQQDDQGGQPAERLHAKPAH